MNSDVAVSVRAWCSLGAILGLFGAGFFKTRVGCRGWCFLVHSGRGLAFTGCWPVWAAKFGQILTNQI